MKKADVVSKMRPYQRIAAQRIIEDVLAGNQPSSILEAIARYKKGMDIGEDHAFDDGNGWNGDIRETAIWCLISNGFCKGGVVTESAGILSQWSSDLAKLENAARIEIEFGGRLALSRRSKKMLADLQILGEKDAPKAVYVYTDSRLENLEDTCTKIGRHDHSGRGEVLARIISQYSAGNPGMPLLKYIFRTHDAVRLESELHQIFRSERIGTDNSFGAEWFGVTPQEICDAASKLDWLQLKPRT